ncbi:MAG: cytochrome c biogenesis protein CcsA [Anaerosomatales bacterium]|nr:cytochrome c biogenesis protein CcsA [Anaerosomatales bacterium]
MALAQIAVLLHLGAAVLYACAFVAVTLHAASALRADGFARVLGFAGLAVHAAGIAALWAATGHGPVVTRFENLSSYAFVSAALGVAIVERRRDLGAVRLVLLPVAFIMLGIALYSGQQPSSLPPTFTGVWLVLHAGFYFLAFGTAATGVAAAVLLMVGDRLKGALAARIGDAAALDELSYRYAGLAFTFWGIGMLTGSIWANHAWGRYWGWDPVETWSLITWLLFAAYLHLRRFYAWSGRKAAVLLVVCFALALMSLFGTSLITRSVHSVYFRS